MTGAVAAQAVMLFPLMLEILTPVQVKSPPESFFLPYHATVYHSDGELMD